MSHFSRSRSTLNGESRGTDPIVCVRAHPKLVFYPGEIKHNDEGTLVSGTIYVVQAGHLVYRCSARGGPKTAFRDGEHWARPTPAGTYTLGPRHHHVTSRWFKSTIPWGAKIRRSKSGIVEFKDRGVWMPATGKHGKMTIAYLSGQKPQPGDERGERPASIVRSAAENRKRSRDSATFATSAIMVTAIDSRAFLAIVTRLHPQPRHA